MSPDVDFDDTSRPDWRPQEPHNGLSKLPPRAVVETRAVLKQCIGARAAVAALDQATRMIPNSGMLINTLPLLEAQASAAIENIVTTADALFRHLDAWSGADAATREALRYREALLQGAGNWPK
jgi:Fic family protein